MFTIPYRVDASRIPGAGRGVFLLTDVVQGSVIVSPDRIDRVYSLQEKLAFQPGSIEDTSSVRWFERFYTVSADWPDECNINHSFSPNGLWHLGFVFAGRDIKAGEELTVDYRFLVDDDELLPFNDAESGKPIIGLKWADNIRMSTEKLLSILKK